MPIKRKLVLTRETLAELTADELRDVVGGAPMSGNTCPIGDCFGPTILDCLTRMCW